MASVTVRAIINDSLTEIGVLAGGEQATPGDATLALARLNQVFDNYNAMREASYIERFDSFTFIPGQQDYTLGPSTLMPDFALVNARPSAIDNANVILTNVSPSVRNPIAVRDYQWWAALSVRAVSTTFPTDLYYEADWPLGILHFWPVPSAAYGLELVTTNTFSVVAISDTLNLPSGYQNALMLTLAEDLASGPFTRPWTAAQAKKVGEARQRIFSVNNFTPRLATQDAGMPANLRNRATFNYRTGLDMKTNR